MVPYAQAAQISRPTPQLGSHAKEPLITHTMGPEASSGALKTQRPSLGGSAEKLMPISETEIVIKLMLNNN